MQPLAWDSLKQYEWLPVPVWVYDLARQRIRWANAAAESLWLADSQAELLSRDLSDLSPAAETRLRALQQAVASKGTGQANWTLYPRGQPTQVALTAVAVTLPEGGEGLCFQALRSGPNVIDPAALRGVEAVLHFSLAVVMFDMRGQVLMQNPAALRAFSQLALTDEGGFYSLLPSRGEAERIWQAAVAYGVDQGERQFCARPKPRWYAYSLHRVLDPVDGGMAMLLTAQDVSERVQSEQKFRVLFEQSANPMALYDPKSGRVVDCNRAASQALRLASRKQFIDTDPARFYPPRQPDGGDSRQLAVDYAERALKLGWHRYEWQFLRSDGSELLVEITVSPVTVGERQLLLAVWYDLSFRKLIERRMLEAKEEAEAANQAKSQFLANMSHEIRTPLNAIVGMTGMLLAGEVTETQRQRLEIVRFSSEGLVALVGDILDFSRIEAGKLSLEARVFDLRALAARTSELLRFTAEEKGLSLAMSMGVTVPRWVDADEGRLRQVLVNLLGNAIKFTERGRVSLHLEALEIEADSAVVRISVSDTGIGIPADKLDSIFEAFSQADDSFTRRYGGSGLGLTISRRLIRAMGGELQVQSVPGQGSEFSFCLPLRLCDAPEPGVVATPLPAAAPLRILLAEDNAMNQQLACALLEQDGHKVTVAHHGGEALDHFMSQPFDLILMDMQMPEMDGLAATRAIRALEEDGHLPIVAMTANAMPEDRERCLAAGMDDFLTKPISVGKLRQVLAQIRPEGLEPARLAAEERVPAPLMVDTVFDPQAALETCGGNAGLVRELTSLFSAEWPSRRMALQVAWEAGDLPAVAKLAHTLKGSFGALASSEGVAASQALEQAAKQGGANAAAYARLLTAGEACLIRMAEWVAA
ncbi:hypothetical protein GCM10007907_32600 [Chitinimonas prasina]|uniref:histidine kinase n=1 Tax=Chitinimonas prasina TaxID=1434937 RepID=A0ABQ5YM64_9NEIS|nr:ATP-binding protein [Chitinimonas prasina]GLR14470.1 hypothetical protein GCM10007907_32600 [Chitinimonas prasina]